MQSCSIIQRPFLITTTWKSRWYIFDNSSTCIKTMGQFHSLLLCPSLWQRFRETSRQTGHPYSWLHPEPIPRGRHARLQRPSEEMRSQEALSNVCAQQTSLWLEEAPLHLAPAIPPPSPGNLAANLLLPRLVLCSSSLTLTILSPPFPSSVLRLS